MSQTVEQTVEPTVKQSTQRFEDLIIQYRVDRLAAGDAKTTVKQRNYILHRYLGWSRRQGKPDTLAGFTTEQLQGFALSLMAHGLRPRTQRGMILSMRSFGAWLVEKGAVFSNPAARVPLPKLDAARRQACTDQEVVAILEACDRFRDKRRGTMARAIINVFAHAGLRRTECLTLQLGDVDLNTSCIQVRKGKGGKDRQVYIHPDCVEALRRWLRVRGECRHANLWAGYDAGRRLGDAGLRVLFEELRSAAGLRDCLHILPHSIRHGYASRLLAAGASVEDLRVCLGHASIVTTGIYLHSNPARLREVAKLSGLDGAKCAPAVQRAAPRFKRKALR